VCKAFPDKISLPSEPFGSPQHLLQIFNLETKAKVMSYIMNNIIVFWKWVSETIIGLVTNWSVYHWTIADEVLPPQKMFDLKSQLFLPACTGTSMDSNAYCTVYYSP
jgi:hypothetical protein